MTQRFTCPMHPDVVSEKPGRCPKCGMELISVDARSPEPNTNMADQGLGPQTWRNYVPLIVIVAMIAAAAAVAGRGGGADFLFPTFVLHFMTGFFLVFSGFKLIDLKGFAQGYFTYDLLAGRVFAYGYVYPFIEFAFGLLMLAGFHPDWLLWTEFGVMAFSGLGVARKLVRREKFQCVCLGTFLKVPLTYVTLVEDLGMAFLALALIRLQ